jgi:predicted RNase H-like HicB family nuclease
MLEYHAACYWHADTKWYTVEVLDFRGVITQGRTLNSARRMVKDALQVMAECLLEAGEPLSRPNQRAKDAKADLVEPILLSVRARGQDGIMKARSL